VDRCNVRIRVAKDNATINTFTSCLPLLPETQKKKVVEVCAIKSDFDLTNKSQKCLLKQQNHLQTVTPSHCCASPIQPHDHHPPRALHVHDNDPHHVAGPFCLSKLWCRSSIQHQRHRRHSKTNRGSPSTSTTANTESHCRRYVLPWNVECHMA